MLAKPTSRALLKEAKRRGAENRRREVYRLVEIRDGFKCRVCTRKVVRTMELRLNRLEHHHIHEPGGKRIDSTESVIVACKECHDERHVSRRLHITGNANHVLTFEKDGQCWNG